MGSLEFYATAAAVLPLLMLSIVYESGVTQRLAELLMEMHEKEILARQVSFGHVSEQQALDSELISPIDLSSRVSIEPTHTEGDNSVLDRFADRLDRMRPDTFMSIFVLAPLGFIVLGFVTSLVALFLGGLHPALAFLVWPGLAAGVMLLSGLIIYAVGEQSDIARQAARYRLRQLGLFKTDYSTEGVIDELQARWAVKGEARRKALAEFLRTRGG